MDEWVGAFLRVVSFKTVYGRAPMFDNDSYPQAASDEAELALWLEQARASHKAKKLAPAQESMIEASGLVFAPGKFKLQEQQKPATSAAAKPSKRRVG